MKQRSTTPVSKGLATKSTLVAASVLMTIGAPFAALQATGAVDYDAKIKALEQEEQNYLNQAKQYQQKADTLQNKLDAISNEKQQIQNRIDIDQAKYNKIKQQIADTNQEIADNREALGEVFADLSADGDISPLEMLASSSNIGDFLDKQSYQSAIRDQLSIKIDEINALKEKLQEQQEEIKIVLASQRRARDTLAEKEAEQAQLVSDTRGKESSYKKLSAKVKAEKLRVMQAQAAAIAAASAGNGGVAFVGGSDGGYPWNASNCYVDANAMSHGGSNGNGGDGWGYGCRQCASYVAWKIGQRTGTIPTYLGNAKDFPGNLSHRPQGYTAKKNSVAVISSGVYGHVAWVESNPDANGFITVSQYNANYTGASNNWGNFTRVVVHQSTYDKFIYY